METQQLDGFFQVFDLVASPTPLDLNARVYLCTLRFVYTYPVGL